MFPVHDLAGYANDRASNSSDAEMLEGFDPAENGGWLRQCSRFAGTSIMETGADRAAPSGGAWVPGCPWCASTHHDHLICQKRCEVDTE
jgi:hypothetical protein